MSFREEERQKNACPSRGLGLAAAAIGVGVGAALYYFFSKRPENPATEGSTSHDWSCESPQALYESSEESDNSYLTISENTTSDTSILANSSLSSEIPLDYHSDESNISSTNETGSISEDDTAMASFNEDSHMSFSSDQNENQVYNMFTVDNDENSTDWITEEIDSDTSTLDVSPYSIPSVPSFEQVDVTSLLWNVFNRLPLISSVRSHTNERAPNRQPRPDVFRERRWSLEECSICFEVILSNQEVMSLPCTHNFHQACILPWLQEQQTCPNCRKAVE